jgi:hypothetical protein
MTFARIASFGLAIALAFTACSSKGGGSATSTGDQHSASSSITAGAQPGSFRTPGPHAPPEVAIAAMAYDRLGGSRAPAPVQVTAVSIVGNYGLAVVQIGRSTGETLFEKEKGSWRVLASNAYIPGGRGLLRFGISQDLARQLDASLRTVQQ